MKRFKQAVLGLAVLGAMGTATRAEPLDVKTVPADSKWVMHLDVDAIVKSETWKLVQPKLQNNPKFAKGKADIERVGNVKLPDDIHGVTLFGPTFGEKDGVLLIHANFNQERLTTLLSLNETYATSVVGGHTIHEWSDKGKQLYASFANNNRIVVSQSKEQVADALDTLSGKLESLKDSPLTPEQHKAGVLLYVAGDELAKLAERGARHPVVQKLDSAWITVREDGKDLSVKSRINGQDEATAQNVKNGIDGLKAAMSFAAQDNPDAMLVSEAISTMTAAADGKAVNIDWTLPVQSISDLLDRATGDVAK